MWLSIGRSHFILSYSCVLPSKATETTHFTQLIHQRDNRPITLCTIYSTTINDVPGMNSVFSPCESLDWVSVSLAGLDTQQILTCRDNAETENISLNNNFPRRVSIPRCPPNELPVCVSFVATLLESTSIKLAPIAAKSRQCESASWFLPIKRNCVILFALFDLSVIQGLHYYVLMFNVWIKKCNMQWEEQNQFVECEPIIALLQPNYRPFKIWCNLDHVWAYRRQSVVLNSSSFTITKQYRICIIIWCILEKPEATNKQNFFAKI